MEKRELVIIGGGPAGLAAAISAREEGVDYVSEEAARAGAGAAAYLRGTSKDREL